jgi:hypothetical protein
MRPGKNFFWGRNRNTQSIKLFLGFYLSKYLLQHICHLFLLLLKIIKSALWPAGDLKSPDGPAT